MTETRKYQEVLSATREYMAKVPDDAKPTKVMGAYWDIGQEMRAGLRERGTRQDDLNAERFFSQVRRALDELAKDGTLVKIGKGDRNPQGFLQSTPQYYTPAQYEHAQGREQAKRRAERETDQRWEGVYDELEQFGLIPSSDRGKPVMLPLDMWERITPTLSDLVR